MLINLNYKMKKYIQNNKKKQINIIINVKKH